MKINTASSLIAGSANLRILKSVKFSIPWNIVRVKFNQRNGKSKKYTKTKIVSDRTCMILKKLGFEWPKVNPLHIEKMIEYCDKVGFLNFKH